MPAPPGSIPPSSASPGTAATAVSSASHGAGPNPPGPNALPRPNRQRARSGSPIIRGPGEADPAASLRPASARPRPTRPAGTLAAGPCALMDSNACCRAQKGKHWVGCAIPPPTPRRFQRGIGSPLSQVMTGGLGGTARLPQSCLAPLFEGFRPLRSAFPSCWGQAHELDRLPAGGRGAWRALRRTGDPAFVCPARGSGR